MKFRYLLLFLGCCANTAFAQTRAECVNISIENNPSFSQGAKNAGIELKRAKNLDLNNLPPVIVWYTNRRQVNIDDKTVDAIGEHIKKGNSLLILTGSSPGLDQLRFTPIAPTTSYQTLLESSYRGTKSPGVHTGEYDKTFFSSKPDFATDYYYRLRPIFTAEIGFTRHAIFDREVSHILRPLKAGEFFIARNPLNRNWNTRLFADDPAQNSLLITGDYGAGKVAVFASDAKYGTPSFWSDIFKYLAQVKPITESDFDGLKLDVTPNLKERTIVYTGTNNSNKELTLPVVARMHGWDLSFIGDLTGELKLPAKGKGELSLEIPKVDQLSPQILEEYDALQIRSTILSPLASKELLNNKLFMDFTPQVSIQLSCDELSSRERTLSGAEPVSVKLEERGAMGINTYAWKPQEELNLKLAVSNGLSNLAPHAEVIDMTNNQPILQLNDYISVPKGQRGRIKSSSSLSIEKKKDAHVKFIFPQKVTLNKLAILATYKRVVAKPKLGTPGKVSLFADGKSLLENVNLDDIFNNNLAILTFDQTTATEWELKFPWDNSKERDAVRISEIELYGDWEQNTKEKVALNLETQLLDPYGKILFSNKNNFFISANSEQITNFKVVLPNVPEGETKPCLAQVIDSNSKNIVAQLPLLVISPKKTLKPIGELDPKGSSLNVNTIVTKGLRDFLHLGTGAAHTVQSWSSPDDQTYAYSRRLKQATLATTSKPAKLFLSEHIFSHYVGVWGHFGNGELFFSVATPQLVESLKTDKKWKDANVINFYFGDRWDSGPAMDSIFAMQDIVNFDRYLRKNGKSGLTGRTRNELCAEIQKSYTIEYSRWQIENYISSFRNLRNALKEYGKEMVVKAQGIPILPTEYANELGKVIRGMADDSTWGAWGENLPKTTGRQMAHMALNPSWQLATTYVWGWDNTCLNNSFWYAAVGTTESSRRHYVTRAWRGVIEDDGSYDSMHTFAFSRNGYNSSVMTRNDWQQFWNGAEKQSLIVPEAPMGFGLIVGCDILNKPDSSILTGGGMGGSSASKAILQTIADIISHCHHAKISVPYTTNTENQLKYKGAERPLILFPFLDSATTQELSQMAQYIKTKKGFLITFAPKFKIPKELQQLYEDAKAVGKLAKVGKYGVVLNTSAQDFTQENATVLYNILNNSKCLPIIYDDGTCGYGFTIGKQKFVTVEDIYEKARVVKIAILADPKAKKANAVELNNHHQLKIERQNEYWVVELPTRSGDGNLILLEEK